MSIVKQAEAPGQAGLGMIQCPSMLDVFLMSGKSMSLERNLLGAAL